MRARLPHNTAMTVSSHAMTSPIASDAAPTPIRTVPIAAIATAPGRGGIGVVRVSGPDVRAVMQAVCGRLLQPRQAAYLPFLDADGHAIDRGIALWFPAPHSYTGEDVLELQGHGGPVVMQLLLSRCLQAGREIGVRVAEPGEFTRRPFLNDKMDLGPGRGRRRPDRGRHRGPRAFGAPLAGRSVFASGACAG
ncbi:probable trna modification gtpase protein [Ralstonia solanacearum IPO1609]|uniref:Probable trna modification gtpase protein n=1 Tax=Ralstonia solanacearum IPO1609 TaxID=564066 RepID=A0ABF7R8V9_RALSL|nr:probable trna modification gtpase protein [Ralstonia solanacearum IPO1609]